MTEKELLIEESIKLLQEKAELHNIELNGGHTKELKQQEIKDILESDWVRTDEKAFEIGERIWIYLQKLIMRKHRTAEVI